MKISEIFMRDPYVYVEDGVCYLIGTTDHTAWDGPAKGFLGYKSTDLENFDGPYVLFERPTDFWADKNFWAPELHKYKNKYYIVASFKKEGKCRASQMLVSDKPFGKYVPLSKPFTPENWECLDATLYEENGKLYTVFSHEWTQCKDGQMCMAELGDDLSSLKTRPKVLFNASEAKWVRSHTDSKDDFITDGPYLYKLKSNKLLMLWSSNGEEGYAMGMCVSNDGINGKFKHLDKPLFSKDGGHGMIFHFKGKTYVTFHSPNGPFLSERPHFFEVEELEDSLKIK